MSDFIVKTTGCAYCPFKYFAIKYICFVGDYGEKIDFDKMETDSYYTLESCPMKNGNIVVKIERENK